MSGQDKIFGPLSRQVSLSQVQSLNVKFPVLCKNYVRLSGERTLAAPVSVDLVVVSRSLLRSEPAHKSLVW